MKWVYDNVGSKWEVGYYTPYPESKWKAVSQKFSTEAEAEAKCAYLNGKINFKDDELGQTNKVQLSTQSLQIRWKDECYIYVDSTKAKFLKRDSTYLVEFTEVFK